MSRKIILIKQELLLLVYELNRSGLLAENEKIRPILAQLEKLLLCDLSPSTNDCQKLTRWMRRSGLICLARSSRTGLDIDRKSGSAGMPRPISYAVFCLKKKKNKEHKHFTQFTKLKAAIAHTSTI